MRLSVVTCLRHPLRTRQLKVFQRRLTTIDKKIRTLQPKYGKLNKKLNKNEC